MDRQKKTTNLVKNNKKGKNHSKFKQIIVLSIIIFAISLLCLFFNWLNPTLVNWLKEDFSIVSSNNNLLVHFINIGQGDAIAINLPDDKVAIIDTGSLYSTGDFIRYINENVMNNKINKIIDYLILSHADADHIGGAIKLLKNFEFGTIFMPKIATDTDVYLNLCKLIALENCDVVTFADTVELNNGYCFKCYAPLDYIDTNNTCPLIKLTFQGKSFLFTGDLEAKAEKDYVQQYGYELDVDVLKVSHHGSKFSTSEEFLQVVTPEYSVISSGNKYGHPNQETLDRLSAVNTNIVRTDTLGNIMFAVGNNYDLAILTGDYVVSGFIFDYRIILLVIDVVLFINILIVIIKKERCWFTLEITNLLRTCVLRFNWLRSNYCNFCGA